MKTRAPRRGIPGGIALLTTSQTAAVLGVSGRTLLKYVDLGWIAPVGTAGLAYLFDERQVTELGRRLATNPRPARGGHHYGEGEPAGQSEGEPAR